MNIAIITARGGSKRIPRKNIREFLGLPMLAYPIRAARESGIFDEVMVSTEDGEIAETALRYGASVPFMRASEFADDFTPTDAVILHVIEEYRKRGRNFDNICCIYPCSPMLTGEILKAAMKRFTESGALALKPAIRFSQPVQRAMLADENGFLAYREPENFLKRSQDLEPVYYDPGMFYFVKNDEFLRRKSISGDRTIMFEMDEKMAQDIDNPTDWEMAEMKYRMLHQTPEKKNASTQ